jgi:hypothetical protein
MDASQTYKDDIRLAAQQLYPCGSLLDIQQEGPVRSRKDEAPVVGRYKVIYRGSLETIASIHW